jgi:exonuclease VII small subunit
MQEAFTYNAKELESIKQSLSQERLGPYLALVADDLRQAIRLYERNTSLSEALYELLQGIEIALRNAMHRALSDGIAREDWYDSMLWHVAQQEQIIQAKESLQKKAKPITPSRMVAELTFGFWVGLTGPKY